MVASSRRSSCAASMVTSTCAFQQPDGQHEARFLQQSSQLKAQPWPCSLQQSRQHQISPSSVKAAQRTAASEVLHQSKLPAVQPPMYVLQQGIQLWYSMAWSHLTCSLPSAERTWPVLHTATESI